MSDSINNFLYVWLVPTIFMILYCLIFISGIYFKKYVQLFIISIFWIFISYSFIDITQNRYNRLNDCENRYDGVFKDKQCWDKNKPNTLIIQRSKNKTPEIRYVD